MTFIAFLVDGKQIKIEAQEMIATSDNLIVLRNTNGNVALFQPDQVQVVVAEDSLISTS